MELRTWVALAGVGVLAACGEQPFPATRATRSAPLAAPRSKGISVGGGAWQLNAPIPEPLGVAQGATVASADGLHLYHVGGITGDMMASNRVWMYSIAEDSWTRVADLPVSPGIRSYGAAVELDGFIYVFGGYDGTQVLDTTWIYDEAKDSWSQGTSMPGPLFGPAVAADAGVIWVMGGFENTSIGGVSDLVWRYDPALNNWFYLGHGIVPGRLHAVTLPAGNIHLLAGGFDWDYHCSFNFRDLTSSCPPPHPICRDRPGGSYRRCSDSRCRGRKRAGAATRRIDSSLRHRHSDLVDGPTDAIGHRQHERRHRQ